MEVVPCFRASFRDRRIPKRGRPWARGTQMRPRFTFAVRQADSKESPYKRLVIGKVLGQNGEEEEEEGGSSYSLPINIVGRGKIMCQFKKTPATEEP